MEIRGVSASLCALTVIEFLVPPNEGTGKMPNIRHDNDHEHGRVYSVTSAHRVSMARQPRQRCIALSDCRVYSIDSARDPETGDCLDEPLRVIPRVKPRTVANRRNRAASAEPVTTDKRRQRTAPSERQRRDIITQAALGTVYSPDDV